MKILFIVLICAVGFAALIGLSRLFWRWVKRKGQEG